jgi:hypothetical protein
MEFPTRPASVEEWLDAISMGKYKAAFQQHGVRQVQLVCKLDDDQLRRMGIDMVGHRNRLLQASRQVEAPTGGGEAMDTSVPATPQPAASDATAAAGAAAATAMPQPPQQPPPPGQDAVMEDVASKAAGEGPGRSNDPDRKFNSTSSYYISSTLARPDTDEIAFCVAVVIHDHIVRGEQASSAERDLFPYFSEENNPLYAEPAHGARDDKKKKHGVPSEDSISETIRSIYECARFPQECLIIALVYMERLVAVSKVPILVTTWRPILLAALVLAQKVWDDRGLQNVDFSVFCPMFTLKEINHLEKKFLDLIDFDVSVNMSLYASYYFQLRTLCQRQNREFDLRPMDPATAANLEAHGLAYTSRFQKEAAATKTWQSADDATVRGTAQANAAKPRKLL